MTATYPVGIVGAGPVGLALAARLTSFGVPVVVFEAEPRLRRAGSKACLIQGDVLEILDKVGCAEQIRDEGVTWTVARTYVRDREIRTVRHPRPLGFGPFVNISQYRIEQVLLEHVSDEPLCEIRWGHRITGVRPHPDGVAIDAHTDDGPRHERVRYLVACDGVRSAVRGFTGAEWTGYTHRDRFLITDIRAELPLSKDRHFHYDPSVNRGRQLVIHPQPDNVWRIDWQLDPAADIDAELANGGFDARVRAVIGDVPYQVEWVSTYRFHQRVVDRFRIGDVLFAGDAAHALPPYGSRGMNSGIQDADNLAWKLALVLAGDAGDDLLDTYHVERHAAARENLRITEATIRFMIPPNRVTRLARAVLLRLSRSSKRARDQVNSGQMAEPYVYTDSPIVAPDGHPLTGAFAPDGMVDTGSGPRRARELFGSGFVALCFTGDTATARRFADLVLAGDSGTTRNAAPGSVTPLIIAPAGGHLDRDALPPQTAIGYDVGGLRDRYGAGEASWYVIRPDGHIAATGTGTGGSTGPGTGSGADPTVAIRRSAGRKSTVDSDIGAATRAVPAASRPVPKEPS